MIAVYFGNWHVHIKRFFRFKSIFLNLNCLFFFSCIVVHWLSLLHKFIQNCLNSGSALVQILLAMYRRFAMERISNNDFDWKKDFRFFISQPIHKTIHQHQFISLDNEVSLFVSPSIRTTKIGRWAVNFKKSLYGSFLMKVSLGKQ